MTSDPIDMMKTIIPKSDQLNSDDLIGGPVTITIRGVRGDESSTDQPVSIYFDGDNNKPYKPCKSMRRVMVSVWGANATGYIGRSMTLYRDPDVQFGGMKVGGIRISHMSHIDKAQTMALTATRAKRAPYTVQPLQQGGPDVAGMVERFRSVKDQAGFDAAEAARAAAWKGLPRDAKEAVKAASDAAKARIAAPVPETDFMNQAGDESPLF